MLTPTTAHRLLTLALCTLAAGTTFAADSASSTPTFSIQDLGTLQDDNNSQAWVLALSADGSIAAGSAKTTTMYPHAVLWHGKNYAEKLDLHTLKPNESRGLSINALSADGSIAAGKTKDVYDYHAAVWRGKGYADKLDLGTLEAYRYGILGTYRESFSEIYALSADGSIAAGEEIDAIFCAHAGVWRGKDYAQKLDLGTLRPDNSGLSGIRALSADGSIAAGQAETAATAAKSYGSIGAFDLDCLPNADAVTLKDAVTRKHEESNSTKVWHLTPRGNSCFSTGTENHTCDESHAIVWRGKDYAEKLDLGTLRHDNRGNSGVNAMSRDGSIAAGFSFNDNDSFAHAAVWRGKDYAEKLDLGTLHPDNSGISAIFALSADGSIAAGWAANANKTVHAVIWYGKNYANKLDLGTLRPDNSGYSSVYALSADGSIAAGQAEDANGNHHAVIWKITWPEGSHMAPLPAPSAQIEAVRMP